MYPDPGGNRIIIRGSGAPSPHLFWELPFPGAPPWEGEGRGAFEWQELRAWGSLPALPSWVCSCIKDGLVSLASPASSLPTPSRGRLPAPRPGPGLSLLPSRPHPPTPVQGCRARLPLVFQPPCGRASWRPGQGLFRANSNHQLSGAGPFSSRPPRPRLRQPVLTFPSSWPAGCHHGVSLGSGPQGPLSN